MAKKVKAKGFSRSGAGGGGVPSSQGGMMAQFQKMQEDMVKAQDELANETLDITVGGGAVKITITGHQRVQALEIDKSAIDLEDEEWLIDLQDLLVAAVNQAIEQSQAISAERMEGLTGNLGGMLPGGLGGLLG